MLLEEINCDLTSFYKESAYSPILWQATQSMFLPSFRSSKTATSVPLLLQLLILELILGFTTYYPTLSHSQSSLPYSDLDIAGKSITHVSQFVVQGRLHRSEQPSGLVVIDSSSCSLSPCLIRVFHCRLLVLFVSPRDCLQNGRRLWVLEPLCRALVVLARS